MSDKNFDQSIYTKLGQQKKKNKVGKKYNIILLKQC